MRQPQATLASGSTQRNVPEPPKWPNVRGDVREPDQWCDLVPLISTPRPQSIGREATEVGQHAVETRELDARHLRVGLRRDERGLEKLPPERKNVVERPVHAGARMPARVEFQPERDAHRLAHVVGEGHLGPRGKVLAENPKAFVGVDAAPPRRRDRVRALEGQAGGVREQMADGGARRPRRLVEVDDALLGGDQDGQRRDRLRQRREPDGPARVAVRRDDRLSLHDACGRELGLPLVDLAQSVHRAGPILDGRPFRPRWPPRPNERANRSEPRLAGPLALPD